MSRWRDMRSLGYTTQGKASIRYLNPAQGRREYACKSTQRCACGLPLATWSPRRRAKCDVKRSEGACSVLVFVMASLSCSSACGSWSLARGSGFGAGVWVLRCPVGAEHAAGCRLIGLGLSVVSSGCGLGVVSFTCQRSALPGLRRVSAGVAAFVPAV